MTVQEAIKKYKTGGFFSKKSEETAQSKIKPGEQVLWAGSFLVKVHGEEKQGTVVLTNQRFFFCQNVALGAYKDEHYFPIEDIIQVLFSVEKGMGSLAVWTARDVMYVCCNSKYAKPCMEILEKLRQEKKAEQTAQQSTPQTSSTADELLKWKNLLDAGAITQEEYEIKKRQILGF